MPNNYDFSTLREIKTMEIYPAGWINPLIIEYGIGDHTIPSFFWRVKGTQHTFIIPAIRMDYLSSGNYNEHFTEVLEKFREDYISWKKEGFFSDWMSEYRNQYGSFIII